MKKLHLILIFFISVIFVIHAQEQDDERQEFMFDSVMSLMRDKSIPLIERYYMTGDIEHLIREHQIEVLKELLPEAKKYEEKAVIMRLYSLIGNFYSDLFRFDEAEKYIDSAMVYIDNTDNEIIRGVVYYTAGLVYSRQNKISEAHDHYYKAAECFKKKDPSLHILNEIYYNLSIVYAFKNDVESLEELYTWMEDISVVYPVQQVLKYSVQTRFFQALYNNTGDAVYLDSVIMCNRKSFDVYYSEEQPYDVGYQMSENYYSQAEAYYLLQQNDSAGFYLDKSLELANPDNLFGNLQAKLLHSRLLFSEGSSQKAETELLDGLKQTEKLVETNDVYFHNLLSDYYDLLSQIQENQGKMKEALDAGRESLKYELLFTKLINTEHIQDLRAKYDLDNKQRSINQLTEINKMYERNRILYIGLGILLVIIIVLIIFLSRRRYKITQAKLKEAELISQLEQEKNKTLTAKINENEQHYKLILSEKKLEQVNSYLEGLEFERLRLSKELHDNIANNILLVNLRFQDQEQINALEISQQLKAIHEQVRDISHELIPPMFEYASFVEILRDYVCQQNSHDKIAISLSIDPEEEINKISEKICLEFYRIVQECISNAFKHSMASNIEVLLYKGEQCLNLTIIDDGKGFDTKSKKSGIGLIIVNERVKSLNGSININSTIGKGTEFNITAPL